MIIRRVVVKTAAWSFKGDIKEAAGPLQTCAGHGAGAKAAIHAMATLFESDDTEGVLLVDADNAFNRLNRKVALHNISLQCPIVSRYVINCYRAD